MIWVKVRLRARWQKETKVSQSKKNRAMTYKTILAYMQTPEAAVTVLDVTVPLAKEHGAHLIGLHTKPFVEPYEVYGTLAAEIPPSVYAQRQEDIDRDAAEVRKVFDVATADSAATVEWREGECLRSGFASTVVEHGKIADLIIAAQTTANKGFDPWLSVTAQLVMEAGRPVLLVPTSGRFKTVGRRPMITWNETRESARAAFDTIPLLTHAANAQILSVDEGAMRLDKAPLPGEGLAVCLARHDIKCTVQPVTVQNLGVGEEILRRADYDGVDLLVMGCFGRSRLREYVFGGVTEHVMRNMNVPVLTSH
ncbi:MAG: universal stress protein [Hyphomicrobiaceae bacterium]